MERRDGSHLSEGISSLFISQHENAVNHLVGNKTGNLRPAAASVPRRCCPLLETPFPSHIPDAVYSLPEEEREALKLSRSPWVEGDLG